MADPAADTDVIFANAIEIASPEEREAYLRQACGADADRYRRLERLVAAHYRAGTFLDSPATALSADLSDEPPPVDVGTTVGPYTLVQQIGEGGMGSVFRARQSHPLQRDVALKVIKLGMDTRQVIARFEQERQALAIMDHPNIAKVLDAGVTAMGRPYFVMELVSGVAITQFCDENVLTVNARLQLYAQVCSAVQHAHQKGVIHRDIKPSNVLVASHDGQRVAKVIDFGIAKATAARLTEQTRFTEFAQLIGTPEYMSPEQAAGDADIDTRSDVYSLGVLLYELLVGAPPFDGRELRSKAYAEMQRVIREVDPPAPSTRLSTLEALPAIAAQRGLEPRRLASTIRGELDWIVMRCLAKDRARRYESAGALVEDVQRFLGHEPVSAGPPSRAYRLRKFLRRHRAGVTGAAVVLLLLVGGIAGTSVGLLEARRQRDEAQRQEGQARQQAAIAEAVSKFQSDMLASADPNKLLGDKVTVLQAMSAAAKELEAGKLRDQPLVEAKVRDTIGNTLRDLGRFDLAEPNLRQGLELRRRSLPAGSRPIAQSAENLALLLQWQRKFDESESMHREALSIFRALDPPDEENVATALNNLGWLMVAQGRYAEAETLVSEALAIYRRILPPDHPFIPLGLSNIAHVLIQQEKPAEAEPVALEALAAMRKSLPRGHPNIAAALSTVVGVLARQGKFPQAEPYARESLALFRASLPADHPNIAISANTLGIMLHEQGKFAEAEPLLREALQIRRKSLPPTSPEIANSLHNLALLLDDQKMYSDCDPLFRDAIAAAQSATPRDELLVAKFRRSYGNTLARAKRYADSERELLEAERIVAAAPGVDATRRAEVAESLASLYALWDQAEPGKGYDAKARQWQQRLPATGPATTPATPR